MVAHDGLRVTGVLGDRSGSLSFDLTLHAFRREVLRLAVLDKILRHVPRATIKVPAPGPRAARVREGENDVVSIAFTQARNRRVRGAEDVHQIQDEPARRGHTDVIHGFIRSAVHERETVGDPELDERVAKCALTANDLTERVSANLAGDAPRSDEMLEELFVSHG